MGSFFGIALTLVIIAGSELFTGHSMLLTFGALTTQITWKYKFTVLPQTWVGNLLGCIGLAIIFMYAGGGNLMGLEDSLIHKVALAKTSAPALILFAKGILCNWLVCLAIWMCVRTEGTGKFIAIWWCLAAFIMCGYEHIPMLLQDEKLKVWKLSFILLVKALPISGNVSSKKLSILCRNSRQDHYKLNFNQKQ